MRDTCYKALADAHRRRILAALCRRPMRAGEVARLAGLAPNTLSFHLRCLRQAGLVTVTRQGRFLWYRAVGQVLDRWLAGVAAEFGQAAEQDRQRAAVPEATPIVKEGGKAAGRARRRLARKSSLKTAPTPPKPRKTAKASHLHEVTPHAADSVPDDILPTELL